MTAQLEGPVAVAISMLPVELSKPDKEMVSRTLNVPEAEVVELIERGLKDDLTAVDSLWRMSYLKAMSTSDPETIKLSQAILAWRTELDDRLRGQVDETPPAVPETPGQTVRRAAGMIAGSTTVAVKTLERIARYGRSESARVAAARALLDRAGLAGAERIEVTWANEQPDAAGEKLVSPLSVLLERLTKIKEAKLQ